MSFQTLFANTHGDNFEMMKKEKTKNEQKNFAEVGSRTRVATNLIGPNTVPSLLPQQHFFFTLLILVDMFEYEYHVRCHNRSQLVT